jgi:hypothetical protein
MTNNQPATLERLERSNAVERIERLQRVSHKFAQRLID